MIMEKNLSLFEKSKGPFMKFLIMIILTFLISCSRVIVNNHNSGKYDLTCYYSESKCRKKMKNLCSSNQYDVIQKNQGMETSWGFFPFQFVAKKRPVFRLLIQCKDDA